jgi:hypothetical protein
MCAERHAESGTQQNAYQAEPPAHPPQDRSTVSRVITEHRLAVIRAEGDASRGCDRGGVVTAHARDQLPDWGRTPRGGARREVDISHRPVHRWDWSGAPGGSDGGEVVAEDWPVQLQ